ncbi:MAG: mechanosensitive ion channel family protein [Candidatus Levyibacteriota bacterium]
MNGVNVVLQDTLNTTLTSLAAFIPRFISGLIVLLIGVIIATFLKQVLQELFKFVRFNNLLKRYGFPEAKDGVDFANILSEMVRWFVIVLFLVPTSDVWGLGRFVEVLNNVLLFLPNVFVSVLLLIVGFVIAKLVHDVVIASVHGVSKETRKSIALVARYSVLVFVFLIVLNQLGIASDLIRILFGGIVAMVALAGGLAFGLGGRESAKEILDKVKKKI